MDRTLSQQEIDAIVNSTQRKAAEPTARQRLIQACNFRTASQLSNEHGRAISALHEAFARTAAHSLGAYLRVNFSMALSSLAQLTYREYLSGLQDAGYLVPFRLNPLEMSGLLQVDLSLVFPIIDILLGGGGGAINADKELTEIDEDVMAGVARIVANQLQTTWQALEVEVVLDRCQKTIDIQETLPPSERVLLLTFEIGMGESNGALRLLFPASFASALLRKAPAEKGHRKSAVHYLPGPDLRERLLNCDFDTAVGIASLKIKVRDLLSLKPGDVMPFAVPVTTPAALLVGGRELFGAAPVRNGNKRAGQLLQPVQLTQQDEIA